MALDDVIYLYMNPNNSKKCYVIKNDKVRSDLEITAPVSKQQGSE